MAEETVSLTENNITEEKTELFNWNFMGSKKVILYTTVIFIALVLMHIIAYFGIFSSIPNFLGKYIWWIFYLDVSVAALAGALWYYASYKGYVSCMASMMIGMTVGMQTGMMLGAVFGAVNGFFIGAMVGMILGTIAGVITGRSSVMGFVQGMMSGVMGGTMSAMITVMMFTDHILVFMPFYMIINVVILAGFVYMYHDEVIKDNKEIVKDEVDLATMIAICIIFTAILTTILVYAPKSLLFGN